MKRAYPLITQSMAGYGFTHGVELDYTEFTAAALTETIPLISVPAGTVVRSVMVRCDIGFGDGGNDVDDSNVTVGDGDDVDRFIASSGVFTTDVGSQYVDGGSGTFPHQYASADTIDLVITNTGAGGNVANFTTGRLTVLLDLVMPVGL